MSKHTWLTAPSQLKADRLLAAFREARRLGYSAHESRVFAGYFTEVSAQAGDMGEYHPGHWVKLTPGRLLAQVERGGWRILRSRNAGNYVLTWERHTELLVWGYADRIGLSGYTPWQVV